MERTKFPPLVLRIITAKAFKESNKIILQLELTEKQIQQLYIYSNNIKNKIKTKKNTLLVDKKYFPLAKRLSRIIRVSKKIKHTPKQIIQWCSEIRKLVEVNGVSYERVEKALYWYKENIGGQYIPVIESGYSLKNKFQSLEGAIERSKNPLNGSKPKRIMENGEWWYLNAENGKYYNDKSKLLIT